MVRQAWDAAVAGAVADEINLTVRPQTKSNFRVLMKLLDSARFGGIVCREQLAGSRLRVASFFWP